MKTNIDLKKVNSEGVIGEFFRNLNHSIKEKCMASQMASGGRPGRLESTLDYAESQNIFDSEIQAMVVPPQIMNSYS